MVGAGLQGHKYPALAQEVLVGHTSQGIDLSVGAAVLLVVALADNIAPGAHYYAAYQGVGAGAAPAQQGQVERTAHEKRVVEQGHKRAVRVRCVKLLAEEGFAYAGAGAAIFAPA